MADTTPDQFQTVVATNNKIRVTFSPEDASFDIIEAFYPAHSNRKTSSRFSVPEESSILQVRIDDPFGSRKLQSLRWRQSDRKSDSAGIIVFTSDTISTGVYCRKRYELFPDKYLLLFTLSFYGDNAQAFSRKHPVTIALSPGEPPRPPKSDGYTSASGALTPLYLAKGKPHRFLEKEEALKSGTWFGFRNRFWALLMQTDQSSYTVRYDKTLKQIVCQFPESSEKYAVTLYTGPIENGSLTAADPGLTPLLYTHLWFWVRRLSFGLLWILNQLVAVVGNHGVAILLLSVCVKILMWPLVIVAERWQREVNAKKSLLQPILNTIKKEYRGEERHKKTLEAYKQNKVHPLFTLKSLFSAAIQIPIFFAAYHTLSENVGLSGVSFLWIDDLSLPDRIVLLPITLPFFGSYINLLPFLMTVITLLTSWIFHDASLSGELARKQRRNLYLMALLFFILFYLFPAGMVLYWTMNNFLAFIVTVVKHPATERF
jgi:YidC/Oxa1 family membrane protein insertase